MKWHKYDDEFLSKRPYDKQSVIVKNLSWSAKYGLCYEYQFAYYGLQQDCFYYYDNIFEFDDYSKIDDVEAWCSLDEIIEQLNEINT